MDRIPMHVTRCVFGTAKNFQGLHESGSGGKYMCSLLETIEVMTVVHRIALVEN